MIKLKKGELLYILRRRRGLNQAAFAKRYGITHDVLSEIEKGRRAVPPNLRPGGRIAPTKGERVTALRRRLGLSIPDLAHLFDISHITLIARERGEGDASEILDWLEERVRNKRQPKLSKEGR